MKKKVKEHRMGMQKMPLIHSLVVLLGWIAGVLVSLAVGFGMIDGVLNVRFIPVQITAIAGWIVVVFTLISAVLAIFDR